MILKSKTLAVLVVLFVFGGISFSSALGWWETTSRKQAAQFQEGEFAGEADPADIRGSYTFGDVETNFGIPAALIAQAFGIQTSEPGLFQVKSLEELYANRDKEIGTASVRLFVAFYKGLPYNLSTDTYILESGALLLADRNLTAERVSYLKTHTVPNELGSVQPEIKPVATAVPETLPREPIPTAVSTHVPSSDQMIKGKTTFADLLDWGISSETIEKVIGLPLPTVLGMTVKDFCTQNGLAFEPVKTALQAELDR